MLRKPERKKKEKMASAAQPQQFDLLSLPFSQLQQIRKQMEEVKKLKFKSFVSYLLF